MRASFELAEKFPGCVLLVRQVEEMESTIAAVMAIEGSAEVKSGMKYLFS